MHKSMYSVLRYVPDVPRQEFVNVGVLLICPELKFQKVLHIPSFGDGSKAKLLADSDGQFVRHAVGKLARAIENLSINELLGHENPKTLLSTQDLQDLSQIYAANNIQLTPPRSAATANPEVTLQEIYALFVGEVPQPKQPKGVTRKVIRHHVHSVLSERGLFGKDRVIENWEVPVATQPIVDFSYLNHVRHCYQAISLTAHERDVTNAVNAYRQTAHDVREYSTEDTLKNAHFVVLGHVPTQPSTRVKTLLEVLKTDQIEFTDYRDAEDIANGIALHLEAHSPLTSSLRVN